MSTEFVSCSSKTSAERKEGDQIKHRDVQGSLLRRVHADRWADVSVDSSNQKSAQLVFLLTVSDGDHIITG